MTTTTKTIKLAMNGVTGRMGTNQHLVRSILAIIKQGGVALSDGSRLIPEPILVGRSESKLKRLAGPVAAAEIGRALPYVTDLDAVLDDDSVELFFDASSTQLRPEIVTRAIDRGKAVYCEKPLATNAPEAVQLAQRAEAAGVKHGVVQDKLWLPGIRKLAMLRDQGFFGQILSVRGDFGYWVFTGHDLDQPAQRPSWNYRDEDGGGIMVDMFCHWEYLIRNTFGPIASLVAHAATDLPERIDEAGQPYKATADDSAYALFLLRDGTVCQFNSSWCTRVRRDDLLTVQVDGTQGSAVAGLRECWVQSLAMTPKPVWNPDIPQPIRFFENWSQLPSATTYENAFKAQWELFLKHLAEDSPFPYTFQRGADGVKLAEAGLTSWRQRRWVEIEADS